MKQVNSSLISIQSRRSLTIITVLVIVCAGLAAEQWSASAAKRTDSFFGFILGSSYDQAKKSEGTLSNDESRTNSSESEGAESKNLASLILTSENRAEILPLSFLQSSATRATVRRGFILNGRIEGSVQQLLGQSTVLNSNAVLTGDLLVPGSPNLIRNGTTTFGGTVVGTGSAQPTNYSVTMNSGSQLGRLLTRTDAVAMPTVAAPPAPTGTRNVAINNSSQSPGDFATLRNLTLNSNVGNFAIPPGTYGAFTANSGSGFILGTAGSTQPVAYNFSSLTLNSSSQLQVVGPVVITVGTGVTINGAMGSTTNPNWLELKIASGGVTLNTGSVLYGNVTSPSTTGTVTINGRLEGKVTADRFTINSGAVLKIIQQGDTTPPVITVQQPVDGLVTNSAQLTVSGTYSDESQTMIVVNGAPATIQGNTFTATVMLNEGSNSINIIATDAAGNQSNVSRAVVRDSIAPIISVQQPSDYSYTNASQISVFGTIDDVTATAVTVNNNPVALNGSSFNSSISLVNEGTNTITIRATDAAGNQSETARSIIKDTIAPTLTLAAPTEGEVAKTLRVLGNAADASPIYVDVVGQPLAVEENGVFRGDLEIAEGEQTIRVTARDAAGNQTQITRLVIIDLSPPEISDITPAEGTVVNSPATISGRVSDASTVTIRINNNSAVVANGSFTVSGIALNEGDNQIVITATDVVANESVETFSLIGRDRTPPASPMLFQVITPTRLAFQTIEGRAESGSTITITGGIETVTAQAAFGTGVFAANVKLSVGINNLTVTARDAENNVSPAVQVAITSNPNLELPSPGSPAQINISTGNAQKGLTNTELPRPLIAIVTDKNGDHVQGSTVRFTVQTGGGQFVTGGNIVDVQTDSLGHAAVRYISGTIAGLQQIRADFNNNLMTPAIFLGEALTAQPGAVTSVSGSVLDQNLRALPNVLVRIGGQQTRTGNDGRFLVSNVPAGPHQLLELIGRDQINLPGRWPNITFDFDVLPGIENQLGRPLFLPRVNDGVNLPLDQNNVVTEDTTYELPVVGGEPPIKVTAKAGTRIIFPPDVTDKRLSVTRIATNRVPMTLEDGLATNLYISVQPSGAVFETPLEVSFPNIDRLPANSEVLMMSFDHDAGRYVRVGTGHVSVDGRTVKSDPGNGIRVGAWHATPPPDPAPEVTVLGHVQIKDNPTFEGKDVINNEAWVEGTRAVLISAPPSLSEAIRLDYRATFSLPRNSSPRSVKMEALTQTQTPTITVAPQTVFIGVGKTTEVVATLTSTASGTPSFKWKSDNDDIATVQFTTGNTEQSSPNTVTITGIKAGTTKIKVAYKSSTGGKTNAEVQVNVVKVEFEGIAAACSGFDGTKVGTSPNFEPFWLTLVANGTYDQPTGGSTSQANVKITPANAANMIRFESTDVSKATVAPITPIGSPQTITLTSVSPGETFIKANLNGVELSKLGVVVRKSFQIPVSFHFVSDTAGHRTNRAANLAAATTVATNFLRDVNAILTPQTGVAYVLRANNGVVLNNYQGDLTDVVSNNDFNTLRTFNDPADGQDFYFVWELERDEQIPIPQPGQTVSRINATNIGTMTVIDDSADSNDVAHEMMHSVVVRPTNPFIRPDGTTDVSHSSIIRELLYPTGHNGRGCLIPKRDFDTTGL